MKRFIRFVMLLVLPLLFLNSCSNEKSTAPGKQVLFPADTMEMTNDFYDNAETYPLEGNLFISVEGETRSPQNINFSGLPKRSVIVKETLLKSEGDTFVGAYRYDGYSLYDILNHLKIQKINEKEFSPVIDLFVEVEGKNGDKAIFSWGEIFYPIHRHEIIIASEVMRIVPSKTKELWTLPEKTRLIAAHDLITERNISEPVKITVRSWPDSYKSEKGKDTVYSPSFGIFSDGKELLRVLQPDKLPVYTFSAIFYGRGRGIHSTQPFTGYALKDVLSQLFPRDAKKLRSAVFTVVAADGYRAVFTYSEIMNRNDQAELLLIMRPDDMQHGVFRLFPAADFFSDRAVKGITQIYYRQY